jgi:2-C-methyl-D-erythritol 2,4-cyclodiphosphate synthase
MRIGSGYDVHAFVIGRPLVLGGVRIPFDQGLAGHSDADVLTHALMDALLSAMRAGDIGALFPDDDPVYAGADSIALLEYVATIMADSGWRLVDADTVLVLERPRVSPYRDEMRERLAGALGVPVECIGVKATTTEGLGFTGREEGVAAHAVVLLERIE